MGRPKEPGVRGDLTGKEERGWVTGRSLWRGWMGWLPFPRQRAGKGE